MSMSEREFQRLLNTLRNSAYAQGQNRVKHPQPYDAELNETLQMRINEAAESIFSIYAENAELQESAEKGEEDH